MREGVLQRRETDLEGESHTRSLESWHGGWREHHCLLAPSTLSVVAKCANLLCMCTACIHITCPLSVRVDCMARTLLTYICITYTCVRVCSILEVWGMAIKSHLNPPVVTSRDNT